MDDVKKIMVAAMHRTGHHAVAVWLLHQLPGISDFSIKTITQWFFYIQNNRGASYLANNPLKTGDKEHPDKADFSSFLKSYHQANSSLTNMVVGTHEQVGIKDTVWACGTSDIFAVNCNLVVVLRDFKNWVASCVKMAHRDSQVLKEEILSDETIKLYMDHCKHHHVLDGNNYILFNKWVRDENYRREIAEELGLEFTDAALNQLSPFGGGSSFSSMEHLKTANAMKVNDRYRGMTGNADYEKIIKENKEALEMSNEIFGYAN
jgi:hypothetical protein